MNMIHCVLSVSCHADKSVVLIVPGGVANSPIDEYIVINADSRQSFSFTNPIILSALDSGVDGSPVNADTLLAVRLLAKMRHNRDVKKRSGWESETWEKLASSAQARAEVRDYLDAAIYYLMANAVIIAKGDDA